MGKLRGKFTQEEDIFLGQKIIEVQRIGAPQDIWFKLGEKEEAEKAVVEKEEEEKEEEEEEEGS